MRLLTLLAAIGVLLIGGRPQPPPANTIEVGAADDTLRYWLAKEALRQGELQIAAQISALQSLATRATSILGWAVTVAGALIAAAISGPWKLPAIVAAGCMFVSSVCCFVALWPRDWALPGHRPAWLLSAPHPTELEVLEGMARGYATGNEQNARRQQRFGKWLRAAWVFFLLAPLAGIGAWIFAPPPPTTTDYPVVRLSGGTGTLGNGPVGSGCSDGGRGGGFCAIECTLAAEELLQLSLSQQVPQDKSCPVPPSPPVHHSAPATRDHHVSPPVRACRQP